MRLPRIMLILALIGLAFSACIPPAQPAWEDVKSDHWADDAVFYEIFVRSFADSNGDGIGDFQGLTQKLDYLNDGNPETKTDLGITGLWLMPIFPSPSYHGYDVTDYYAINPDYGTLQDFQTFLEEAHKRGIQVILDFVINHTSDQHPWFQAAAAGDPKYRDYYIWSDTNPGYKGPWNQDVWHPLNGKFYYGVFVKEMPDLNYSNPAVTLEIEKVASFWLKDIGVDGFRVDGAKHLIEEGQAQENTPSTHAWFKDFHSFYKDIQPEAITVGEVWSPSEQAAPYVKNGELDLVFNFPLADDFLAGATFRDARRVSNSLSQQQQAYAPARYASFLSNHDQTRVMTKVGGEVTRAKAAAAMLLSAPGTPFLYYGEEIGMTGDKPDPELRTPMQWSAAENAGFSTGAPWKAITAGYDTKNVEVESKSPDSLLSLYRELIHIRSSHYALRSGEYVQVKANPGQLFAMLRVAEKESVLVLINLSSEPVKNPTLTWNGSTLQGEYRPTLLYGQGQVKPLSADEQGAMNEYIPVQELPGNGILIVQFR